MNSEVIPFPTGQTNAQLYNHQRNLTAVLRRFFATLAEGGVDLTAIETAIADLETDVAAVQDVNYSFETAIAAQEVLGSFAEVANRAQTQLEINALATINAAIEAHRGTTGVRSLVSVSDAQAAQAAILAIRATDLEGATTTLDGRVDSLDASTASMASQITSTTAALGVTNANVTALTTAVATGDAALAADINSLETNVAGNTASITTVQASVNGIATRYGVYLNAQNEVIGYLQLDGTPLGSVFTVAVDNFRVAKVGTAGGAAVPVFAIQTVNGAAKIAFVGDMIADGTITANALAANSVVAGKIAAGSITADKLSVGSLSAISANLGTVTAGTIQNPAGTLIDDLANLRRYRSDGTMDIDFANKKIEIIF